jgi:tRNA(adenine34) deaminase
MHADEYWMQQALDCAKQAEAKGEVPVGAVIVKDDTLVSSGYNKSIINHDPSAHAEIQALRMAGEKTQNYRLLGTTLYVTLEPCVMCIGAILHARVERLVFGAYDPRAGAVVSLFKIADEQSLNHRLKYTGGVLAETCGDMLRSFFKQRR